MGISKQDVEKIAQLAKLNFSEKEKAALTKQLGEILNYVDKLNELNLDDVPATSQVLESKNVFREDKVEPGLSQDEALQNAPDRHGGFFSVPKVIK